MCQGSGVGVNTVLGCAVMEMERGLASGWPAGGSGYAGAGVTVRHGSEDKENLHPCSTGVTPGSACQEAAEDLPFPVIPWESDSSLVGLDEGLQGEFWGQTLGGAVLLDDLSMDIQDASGQGTGLPVEGPQEASLPTEGCNAHTGRPQERVRYTGARPERSSCTSECSGPELGGPTHIDGSQISGLLSPVLGFPYQDLDGSYQVLQETSLNNAQVGDGFGAQKMRFNTQCPVQSKPEPSVSDEATVHSNELVGSSFTGLDVPGMHGDSYTQRMHHWGLGQGCNGNGSRRASDSPILENVQDLTLQDCTSPNSMYTTKSDKRPAKKRRTCEGSQQNSAINTGYCEIRRHRCRRNRSVRISVSNCEWGNFTCREGIKQSGVLKKFSGLVINEIRLKKVTTCSELVEKLIKKENEHANADYVKRRVYDIINVLEAIGMIKKDDHKHVHWKGQPNASEHNAEIENLEKQIRDLQISVTQKTNCKAQLKGKYDAVMAVMKSPQHQTIQKENLDRDTICLPFVLTNIARGSSSLEQPRCDLGNAVGKASHEDMCQGTNSHHELVLREIDANSHVNMAQDLMEPLTPCSSDRKLCYIQTPLSPHNPLDESYANFATHSAGTGSFLSFNCNSGPKDQCIPRRTFQVGSREDSLTDSHSVASDIRHN